MPQVPDRPDTVEPDVWEQFSDREKGLYVLFTDVIDRLADLAVARERSASLCIDPATITR